MEDISLHILDIVDNSIRAGATKIWVDILEKPGEDLLRVFIADNGPGMDEETKQRAIDPFFTSKPGKKVGLGIALLAQAARESGGSLQLESQTGRGVELTAFFGYSHPDRKPLGDIAGTVRLLRFTHPEIEFIFGHRRGDGNGDEAGAEPGGR
jgi:signal transduction histidine kinase